MPGSSNFVGEFLILLGVFNAKIVIAIIAFTGVVLASVYTLRLFIRAMHNRVGPRRRVARDLAAPTASCSCRSCSRSSRSRSTRSCALKQRRERRRGESSRPRSRRGRRRRARRPRSAAADDRRRDAKAPHIDWAGLSPLIALLGGATVVLLVGLLRPRVVREARRARCSRSSRFGAAIGLAIWQLGDAQDLVCGRAAPRRPRRSS